MLHSDQVLNGSRTGHIQEQDTTLCFSEALSPSPAEGHVPTTPSQHGPCCCPPRDIQDLVASTTVLMADEPASHQSEAALTQPPPQPWLCTDAGLDFPRLPVHGQPWS